VFYRVRLFVLIAAAGTILSLLYSCDPENRHKVLTFFFDGVPPLHQQSETGNEITGEPNTPGEQVVREGTKIRKVILEHAPIKNCDNCHIESSRKNFSLQAKLNEPLPQLCFRCHTQYDNLTGWVHGPVAVGHCLACHNPHRSQEIHLLHEPQPDICYRCHKKSVVELIAGHAEENTAQCSRCHEAHASENRRLLKINWKDN
jgi:predicted CXXCH cytochrome family protein